MKVLATHDIPNLSSSSVMREPRHAVNNNKGMGVAITVKLNKDKYYFV